MSSVAATEDVGVRTRPQPRLSDQRTAAAERAQRSLGRAERAALRWRPLRRRRAAAALGLAPHERDDKLDNLRLALWLVTNDPDPDEPVDHTDNGRMAFWAVADDPPADRRRVDDAELRILLATARDINDR